MKLRRVVLVVLMVGVIAARAQDPVAGEQKIAVVARGFVAPPDDARPMMRWWWFGPAVVKPELEREILAMKQGGIGGFEIQPVYPLALDDEAAGVKNLPYLSQEFLDAVTFANDTAKANGMRVDITLGSGWPYGGSYVTVDHAAAKLRVVAVGVAADAGSVAMPEIVAGELLIAAFGGESVAELKPVEVRALNGRMAVPAGMRVVLFYVSSRTGMQVKRPSVGADGFVLDHLSKGAVNEHLRVAGDALMKAFGNAPPYAVFSDSLEDYGQDWTDDFLPEFARRRGYDLTPYLPMLTNGTGERSAELRHDWGVTLTELINERYLKTIDDWAKAHGTRFRSQTYGDPAVSLSSSRLAQLPEGEGPEWNDFAYARIATSASHLYGRPITSAEAWTWLNAPPFRANPLDMKVVADRFFLEGVNLLIGHGWPYTPPGTPEPGWSLYAAAVFDDHNPWWLVMPDVTKYLQRMCYLLRQGSSANDVALLLPNDDVYAEFKLGKVSLSDDLPKWVTATIMQQIEGAGHNLDFIDAEAIARVGIPYPVLVMPHVERLSPETMKAITAYVAKGGKVIAVGSKPLLAPGFKDAAAISAEVAALSKALFADTKNVRLVAKDSELGTALSEMVAPDMKLTSAAPDVGFIHRRMSDADVYFVVNSSNRAVSTTASFGSARKMASLWDPFTGKVVALPSAAVKLELEPYESRVIVLRDTSMGDPQAAKAAATELADLSHDWTVSFPENDVLPMPGETMKNLISWTDEARTKFFSGVATYTKTVHVTAEELAQAKSLVLDFGKGTPVEVDRTIKAGQRALLEGPVREAAVVSINGKRAGSVWHPPYAIDVTGSLHAGDNVIEVRVGNTGLNVMAGRAVPDYRLLNARYGKRFDAWDADKIRALPSGMLGPVRLMETR